MADAAKRVCFVVGGIGEPDSDVRIHADWLLEEIIDPVMKDIGGFEVIRSDKISAPGMIDAQIIGHLLESEIVIADLSGLNPNAFYEIGLRHMIQKPIVHMQSAEDKIPFDVSLYRAIKFSRIKPSDIRRAREDLRAALNSILSEGYRVDNPVTRARGQISLQLQASPSEKVLSDQLRAIQQRLTGLEGRLHDENKSERGRYVPNGLHVKHGPFDSAWAKEFYSFLKSHFGSRVRNVHTTGSSTNADVDVGGLTTEQIVRLEEVVAGYPGVTLVNLIPF